MMVMRSPCAGAALDPRYGKLLIKLFSLSLSLSHTHSLSLSLSLFLSLSRSLSLALSDCASGTGAEVVPCRGCAGGRDLGVLHGLLLVRWGLDYFDCVLTTLLSFY